MSQSIFNSGLKIEDGSFNISSNVNEVTIDKDVMISSNLSVGKITEPRVTLDLSGSDAIQLPIGDANARPSTPSEGMLRFNTTELKFEGYKAGAWSSLGGTNTSGNLVIDGTGLAIGHDDPITAIDISGSPLNSGDMFGIVVHNSDHSDSANSTLMLSTGLNDDTSGNGAFLSYTNETTVSYQCLSQMTTNTLSTEIVSTDTKFMFNSISNSDNTYEGIGVNDGSYLIDISENTPIQIEEKDYVSMSSSTKYDVIQRFKVKVVNFGYGNLFSINNNQSSIIQHLSLDENTTYIFDTSDSTNSGHPFKFSVTDDGTHGGGVLYDTDVSYESSYVKITTPSSSSIDKLYYYCANHSGMADGGYINIEPPSDVANVNSVDLEVRVTSLQSNSSVNYFFINGVRYVDDTTSLVLKTGETYNFSTYGTGNIITGNHKLIIGKVNESSNSDDILLELEPQSNTSSNAIITIPENPTYRVLYYYCANHTGMGGKITITSSDTEGYSDYYYGDVTLNVAQDFGSLTIRSHPSQDISNGTIHYATSCGVSGTGVSETGSTMSYVRTQTWVDDDYGIIYNGGNVGIGTNSVNEYKLVVQGNVNVIGSLSNVSDDRLKFNEKKIKNGLTTINKLSPELYDRSNKININENLKRNSGYIAQEVYDVPELRHLVKRGGNHSDPSLWGIDYTQLLPYHTKAIQELSQKSEEILKKIPTNNLQLTNGMGYIRSNTRAYCCFNGKLPWGGDDKAGVEPFGANFTFWPGGKDANNSIIQKQGTNNEFSHSRNLSSMNYRPYVGLRVKHYAVTHGILNFSDDRLKYYQNDISNGLQIIEKLTPKNYFKTDAIYERVDHTDISNIPQDSSFTPESGFIAQEIQKIPELKHAVSNGDPNANEEERKFTLDYNAITTYNVAATKELSEKVSNLEKEIEELKKIIHSLNK